MSNWHDYGGSDWFKWRQRLQTLVNSSIFKCRPAFLFLHGKRLYPCHFKLNFDSVAFNDCGVSLSVEMSVLAARLKVEPLMGVTPTLLSLSLRWDLPPPKQNLSSNCYWNIDVHHASTLISAFVSVRVSCITVISLLRFLPSRPAKVR